LRKLYRATSCGNPAPGCAPAESDYRQQLTQSSRFEKAVGGGSRFFGKLAGISIAPVSKDEPVRRRREL
jgi:hypothetical protein